MTETIYRLKPDATELVKVPEDHVKCPTCKGRGYMSMYDMGWSSVMHDPHMAAPQRCEYCGGDGFVLGGIL